MKTAARSLAALALGTAAIVLVLGGSASAAPNADDPVFVGAGDIAGTWSEDEATALLLDGIPGTVFTIGDNVYPDGTPSEFSTYYAPTWGRHKARTRPTPGNHDYHTANATGYYGYFNDGNPTGPAGDSDKGYYSYDIAGNGFSWHVIVLNSECQPGQTGLWLANGCIEGSAQDVWLENDLATSPTNNIVAIFHKPRYSSSGTFSHLQHLWHDLYAGGVDIALSGHFHNYERLAPMNAAGATDLAYGVRQFVVGTGGVPLGGLGSPWPASQESSATSHGVIKFTLHASSYDWQFIPIAGDTFTDSGTFSTHEAPDPLVGDWRANEGSGTTLVNSSGVGAVNNGTILGDPTWITGQHGQAIRFDGTGDRATVADNASLDISGAITMATWVKPEAAGTQNLIKKSINDATDGYELSLSASSATPAQKPFVRFNQDTSGNTYRVNGTTSYPSDGTTWMHVAATYDGATIRLYVNGVQEGQLAASIAIATNNLALGIGAQPDGTFGVLQGAMDDVLLYNTALTASEVAALASITPPNAQPPVADFDGDGDTDIAVYKPSDGVWYIKDQPPFVQWGGLAGDLSVAGDYDGNEETDIAIYRASEGVWYIKDQPPYVQWGGQAGDVPVPGDYDGDGETDIAVYRASEGVWYVKDQLPFLQWGGQAGDVPVPGDYDGDGTTDFAIYRPSEGVWYVKDQLPFLQWGGQAGDVPVPGDYDGNGTTDFAVYRPSEGVWYVKDQLPFLQWGGQAGDVPVPGDYDGDGTTDFAVYRPSEGVWYVKDQLPFQQWGASCDIPQPLPYALRSLIPHGGCADG